MTPDGERTAEEILEALIALPWDQRSEVWKSVRYNDIFCVECGQGEIDRPNPHCQCQNDE